MFMSLKTKNSTSISHSQCLDFKTLPSVMDLEHFIDNFLALRSNQWPMEEVERLLTAERLERVVDFCNTLISMMMR